MGLELGWLYDPNPKTTKRILQAQQRHGAKVEDDTTRGL